MISDVQKLKAELRTQIRARIAALSPGSRQASSAMLCAHLTQSELWHQAKSLLLFAPMPDEPDVWPLATAALAADKTVALPRFSDAHGHYTAACLTDLERDVRIGKYGIREPSETCKPIALADVHLILVPAVAFDQSGHRLGRGKGYYDRLLAQTSAVKGGVAFDEQIVAELTFEAHDQHVDWVVTPKGIRKTAPRG